MKLRLFALFFVLFLAGFISQNSFGQVVTVFDGANFEGHSQSFSVGKFFYKNGDFAEIGNDAVSSLRVPIGMKCILCENEDEKNLGICKEFTQGDHRNVHDINDKTSYIRIEKTVAMYKDDNYSGESMVVFSGDYSDIKSNKFSSISIPTGMEVTIYKKKDFNGESTVLNSSVDKFDKNWNDKVCSVRIRVK